MAGYVSIYAGSNASGIPNSGGKANPFADDFKPGQYARKAPVSTAPVKVAAPAKATPQPQYKSLFNRVTSAAKSVGNTAESAGKAIARPVADVATLKGGKAAHDTAQLSQDITGGAPNYLLKTAIVNPIKENAAIASGNKKAQISSTQQSNQNLGLGKNGKNLKTGLIKTGGEAVLAGSLLAGGGEATAAKDLAKGGIKEIAPKIIRDANIGGAGNAGYTLANNPNASAKDVGKSLAVGMALGGAVPVAGKLVGDVADKTGIGATKDLVNNTKTTSLLNKVKQPTTVGMPIDTATTKSINTLMSKLHTPQRVLDAAKAQDDAQVAQHEATAKVAEDTQKTVESNQKLDNQIELINAKKADDKFTNVDQVKVKQLEAQKVPVKAPSIPSIPGAKTPYDTPEIIAARAQQEKIPSTHLDNSPERQALRAKTLKILDKQGGFANPANAPAKIATGKRADIVLGMPGSGKTNLVDPLLKQHQSRLIDNDEAKKLLGDTNFSGALHQESDDITNNLLKKSVQSGENVVLPMVGKTGSKISDIIDELKHQGYEVHGHYMHVTPETAAQRVVNRFHETGKFVDPDYVVNKVGLHPSQTYDMLKTHEGLHSLQAHSNEVPLGQPHQLIEKRGLLEKSDSAGRPQGKLDAKRSEVSAKTSQGKSLTAKISNSAKRKEYNPNKSEPVSVPYEEKLTPQRSTQEARTSGSALNSETRAVQKGLASEFAGKAEYGAGSYKDEAMAAVKLIKENPEEAKAIALGQKPGDNTIHEVAVAKAVENKALKDKDVNTLMQLAQSPRHSITSEAAQRLGAEGYNSEGSVVKNIAAINRVRQAAAEKKLGQPISKSINEEVRKAIASKPKVTKETVASFIESLKC